MNTFCLKTIISFRAVVDLVQGHFTDEDWKMGRLHGLLKDTQLFNERQSKLRTQLYVY